MKQQVFNEFTIVKVRYVYINIYHTCSGFSLLVSPSITRWNTFGHVSIIILINRSYLSESLISLILSRVKYIICSDDNGHAKHCSSPEIWTIRSFSWKEEGCQQYPFWHSVSNEMVAAICKLHPPPMSAIVWLNSGLWEHIRYHQLSCHSLWLTSSAKASTSRI